MPLQISQNKRLISAPPVLLLSKREDTNVKLGIFFFDSFLNTIMFNVTVKGLDPNARELPSVVDPGDNKQPRRASELKTQQPANV